MLLHLLVGFIYPKIAHFKNILPLRFRHTEQDTPIRLRPLVTASTENEYHNVKDNKRLQKKRHILQPYLNQHFPGHQEYPAYEDIHPSSHT